MIELAPPCGRRQRIANRTQGCFGVLAHHAALVTSLAAGTLRVRHADGRLERWQVGGGFFEVSNNRATVLADAVEEAKA